MSKEYNENEKVYEIWMGGLEMSGEYSPDHLLGTSCGVDFDDAVRRYQEKHKRKFTFIDGEWFDWGCTITDHCLGHYPDREITINLHGW